MHQLKADRSGCTGREVEGAASPWVPVVEQPVLFLKALYKHKKAPPCKRQLSLKLGLLPAVATLGAGIPTVPNRLEIGIV